MPDSSIPETGDKKPVLVEFDGANPIKYLNIKFLIMYQKKIKI